MLPLCPKLRFLLQVKGVCADLLLPRNFPRNMCTRERYPVHSPELGFVFQKASNRPKTILGSCQQDRTSCQHLLAPSSQRSCSLRNWSCRRMSPSHRQSPRLKMRQLHEELTNGNHRKQSWQCLGIPYCLPRYCKAGLTLTVSLRTNLANQTFS